IPHNHRDRFEFPAEYRCAWRRTNSLVVPLNGTDHRIVDNMNQVSLTERVRIVSQHCAIAKSKGFSVLTGQKISVAVETSEFPRIRVSINGSAEALRRST